ncbi:MAG: hypothetical protein WC365_08900 [Candidatus Babeliales bacterium]|jgi:hypothetical protein
MKVRNMTNAKGRAIPNQFIITDDHGFEFFQSYETIIVKRYATGFLNRDGYPEPVIYLDRDAWNYSRTTSKYRNWFLGETTKETKRKIADGTYKLVDLNN